MSYYNNIPTKNTNIKHASLIEKLKKEKEAKQKAYNEKKGHWLFSFFQKFHNPDAEANVKISMRPENGFNPKNVHHYINPEPSREEQLLAKKERGEQLRSSEQLVVENYLKKKADAIKNDFKAIETQKFNASPQTREGRLKLLLNTLVLKIQKNEHLFVANIYLRLQEDDFKLTPELTVEYDKYLKQMEEIVSKLDMTELQFTKFHSQMPPLNQSGFKKFDAWQIEVINNIDKETSVVVNAPTSAGKSVLSAYTTTKGRVMFVVPTAALAWQMSAYIGHVIGSSVPILTATYQSNPNRDGMIELLNRAEAIVGTPEALADFQPFIHNTFKWIVFDEIHMIGKPEGSAMEHIAKVFPNIPVLALSATIGNTDELVDWFSQLYPIKSITKVICDKRFFNLQRFYYNGESNCLESLNPLALVNESQVADGSIINKSLQPTPPNTWDLATKMASKMELGELEPHKYFENIKRIELDHANGYFYKLVKLLVEKYQTDKTTVMDIINSYKHESLTSSSIDLIKLAFTLKKEQKTPAIIFQKNTLACLRMARDFAKNLEELETTTHPKLRSERQKLAKAARRLEKKNKVDKEDETKKPDGKNSKKELKEMVGLKTGKKKRVGEAYQDQYIGPQDKKVINVVSEQEPHPDFILNKDQYFSEGMIETWVWDLKKYFPNTSDTYHYMIKLLWRGVGVYAKGLPDPYLRLVQTLACQKQLAIVFSDQSLVFGVSMPFRTVVIIRDEKLEDDLEPMMFHQMSGRAGRRGLDKEGNVVFAGYSWDRIKELSISEAPIVSGSSRTIYTIPHANQISKLFDTKQDWSNTCRKFLDKTVSEEDCEEFLQGITSNYSGGWSFGYIADNVNHLHMNWKLRYTDECLMASLLIPYLKRAFEGKDHTQENNQVALAHFLCRFISTSSTKNPAHALEDPSILSENPYNQILEQLDDLQIEIPKMIDGRLFQSIQLNSIVKLQSEDATDELRHKLLEFGEKIKNIQHFCFHSDIIGLSRIMGKLLTRIWWIYHTSSPIMKPINQYETEEFKNVDELEESEQDTDYEDDSENDSSDENSDED
jgi:superfamily II RNA helicase